MSERSIPIVAIVGRANVGKSSLFNACLNRREAIVAREAGTTRDKVVSLLTWKNKNWWLVDTAGLKDPVDNFEISIQEQISEATEQAQLVLVVVESDVPITEDDRKAAQMALKSKKPVILIVNKSDKKSLEKDDDWQRLGISTILRTSATQKKGIDELLDVISSLITAAPAIQTADRLRIGILGRPNVGKSSLFNTLAKKQQALVSESSGTTRDVNRLQIKFKNRSIEIMDTAGIRRSGKIERGVEHFSVLRALATIEESDICLLLMDSSELNVQLDQKIAGMIKQAGKGLVLVVSKWDLADNAQKQEVGSQISHHYVFVPWAPLIYTSSITGENVTKIFEKAIEIDKARAQKIKTTELNKWLQAVTAKHPPAGLKNRQPHLNYIVQEDGTNPPSFKIFGSQTKFLHWSYKRYLESELRKLWPYSGTPIKFWFIEKNSKVDG